MMTLQDVIDAVQVQPWKYGRMNFFEGGKAHCPITKELGIHWLQYTSGPVSHAAELLGSTEGTIWDFVHWWDAVSCPALTELAKERAENLRSLGYRVPEYHEIQWERPHGDMASSDHVRHLALDEDLLQLPEAAVSGYDEEAHLGRVLQRV